MGNEVGGGGGRGDEVRNNYKMKKKKRLYALWWTKLGEGGVKVGIARLTIKCEK